MTDDLVTWLRAQLDATEAAIIYYRDGHPGLPCTNSLDDPDGRHYDEFQPCVRHVEAARATPYRDVEFGLAEVEAKRQIVDECAFALGKSALRSALNDFAWTIIQPLALPYAGREGWREEWR